eukprot:9837622-Alexandrium_andersonii.AAC.1
MLCGPVRAEDMSRLQVAPSSDLDEFKHFYSNRAPEFDIVRNLRRRRPRRPRCGPPAHACGAQL